MSREERRRESKSVTAESGPGALASWGPRNPLSQRSAWVTSPPSCFLLLLFPPAGRGSQSTLRVEGFSWCLGEAMEFTEAQGREEAVPLY